MSTNREEPRFSGIIPYLITPLHADETVNTGELERLSRHLIDQGVHGLTPLGSTGEGVYLSLADRQTVARTVIEAAAGRVPVIPVVSSMSSKGAADQARALERMGADGMVLTLDAYFPLSQDAVKDYFLRVADATELPIIIYTNPNFQKIDPGIDLIVELSHHPRFAGLKDASGHTGRLLSIAQRCREGFGIYAASAHIAVSVMLLGGQGVFAGPACVLARENVHLYELCQAGRWQEAMQLQRILWRFNEAFAAYNLAACVKAALEHEGFSAGEPMAPQPPLAAAAKRNIGILLDTVKKEAVTMLPDR